MFILIVALLFVVRTGRWPCRKVLNDFLLTGYVVVLLDCHPVFIIDHGVFPLVEWQHGHNIAKSEKTRHGRTGERRIVTWLLH